MLARAHQDAIWRRTTAHHQLWLLLRELEASLMVALSDPDDERLFPALSGFRPSRYSSTVALCSIDGSAVAFLPTDRPATDPNAERLEVMVQQFGKDPHVAHRLLRLVQEWHQIGRPYSGRMEMRAYSKEKPPAADDAIVIPAGTRYGFTCGESGMEFLTIRTGEATVTLDE